MLGGPALLYICRPSSHSQHMMLVLAVATLLGVVATFPAEDTAMVGSSLLQASVAPPPDLQAAGDHSRAGGDKGYHHSYKTKGGDGYKHFDSFHKKDGDSFGYEKHSTFGKGDHGEDGGQYHESSSYDSGDGASSSHNKPKVTAYHYESNSGTPRDYSNYDPETYEGDYTNLATRRVPHPDVEVTGPLAGEQYQTLYDISGGKPAPKKSRRLRTKGKDPQAAGTEDDAEYDYYSAEEEGDGDEGSYEGDYEGEEDYEGEGGSEADYYY